MKKLLKTIVLAAAAAALTATAALAAEGWTFENNQWVFYQNDSKVYNTWKASSDGKYYYLGDDGGMGKKGTSHEAMAYIAHWLEACGEAGQLDLTCRYLTGEEVSLAEGGALRKAIERGGVATVFIDLDGWHFILLTGLEGDRVYAFDPWILPEPFPVPDVQTDYDHPYLYNRIVPRSRVESTDIHPYSLAPYETRCAVVMEKGRTQR